MLWIWLINIWLLIGPIVILYWTYLVITTFRSVRRACDLYYRMHTRGPSRTRTTLKKTSPAAEALEKLASGQ